MGKSSDTGTVNIVFGKPYYLAGEIVAGVVHVNLLKPVKAKCLKVKFKGKCKTKIENTVNYQDAEGNFRTRQDEYKQEEEFFKNEVILQEFNEGIINPGNYQLPFQYQLPGQLPGIFFDERKESDGDKIKCAVMYKVKVCLDIKGSDLEDKEFLTVNSAVTTIPKPILIEKSKKFMFGGKGRLHMKCELAKNVFIPGEVVYIKCSVNNESKKKVSALKVKLMREVTVIAKSKKKFKTSEIQRKVFPGVDKKSSGEIMLDIKLSPKMFPSTDANLVKCSYYISVVADVKMASDLEAHPKIVLALLPAPGQTQMWNPFQNYTKGW